MNKIIKFPIITMMLLFSFPAANGIMLTPALPELASYFAISNEAVEQIVSFFIIGYTISQLIYGPLANRFGRKTTLISGIVTHVFACILMIASYLTHLFHVFIFSRFLLAIGSGAGLKMTITMINDLYSSSESSHKISLSMLGFSIITALSILLGGYLTMHFGILSIFIVTLFYGLVVLFLVTKLPETLSIERRDMQALKINQILKNYCCVLKNINLLWGGILWGLCSAFFFTFSTIAPLVTIDLLGMNSEKYGVFYLLPSSGLTLGAWISAQCSKNTSLLTILKWGVGVSCLGVLSLVCCILFQFYLPHALFFTMMLINLGLNLIIANAAAIALATESNKSYGSALISFINLGVASLVLFLTGFLTISVFTLPEIFIALALMLVFSIYCFRRQ